MVKGRFTVGSLSVAYTGCEKMFSLKLFYLYNRQHFHQLAKDNQLSNDLRQDGGNNENMGNITAATEKITLSDGDAQTMSFDD